MPHHFLPQVYKGTRRKTDTVCAVKVMNLELMNKRFKKKFLPRELASLMEIKHEVRMRVCFAIYTLTLPYPLAIAVYRPRL